MIGIMQISVNRARLVYGRCDTCIRNLYKSICALNCSPKQSDFLVGTNGTKENDDGDEGKWEESTTMRVIIRSIAF